MDDEPIEIIAERGRKQLGKNLKDIREAMKLSQDKAGGRIGKCKQQVHEIESGNRKDIDDYILLAEVGLKVPFAEAANYHIKEEKVAKLMKFSTFKDVSNDF